MAITFLKFPSIVNKENINTKHKINFKDLNSNNIFYATEKIDGSNTQIAITNNEYLIGKRHSYLDMKNNRGDQLYMHVLDVPEVKKLIRSIQYKLKQKENNNYVVHIYGELYGPKISGNKYKLKNYQYKVFNIIVHTKQDEHNRWVLGRELLEQIVPDSLLLKIEHKGTLKDISATLDKSSNFDIKIREGNVYAPYDTYLWKYQTAFRSIKYKNDEFKEVKKYISQSQLDNQKEQEKLMANINRYITENRLNNILSHGDYELSFKNMGNLIKAMQNDIREEYAEPISDQEMFDQVMNKLASKKIADLIVQAIKNNN